MAKCLQIHRVLGLKRPALWTPRTQDPRVYAQLHRTKSRLARVTDTRKHCTATQRGSGGCQRSGELLRARLGLLGDGDDEAAVALQ